MNPDLILRADAARRAVLSQTDFLQQAFGRVESKWKSDGTRVTDADIAISESIVRELRVQFPEDQFFSEELADDSGPIALTARFSWVLDPIDGTNNFALGIPYCAISLGLVEWGEPVYGVVYDFSRKTLMHGGPGFGAHDGSREASVTGEQPHREMLIGLHSPSNKSLLPVAEAILSSFKIRGLGSASLHLAYVGAGLLAGCIDFNVKIWDLAAAIPFCRAAGGEIHFLNGAQLPMKYFNLKMERIVYYSGSPAVCAKLGELTSSAMPRLV